MATNAMKDLAKGSLNDQHPAKLGTLSTIKSLISSDSVKKRFEDVLGQKAPQFLASITSLVSSSTNFNGVDPNTIIASALIAATLDLPVNPSLGFAYIIPYNSKNGKVAQFQLSYRSYIQLALRSGLYRTINATEIYEGELTKRNRLTGEFVIDESAKASDKIIGYAAHFKLLNGFEKSIYLTVEEIESHGKKFSKSFNSPDGLWKKDFHSMAMKTVIKLLLSKYGILSVEMQKAVSTDQAVVDEEGNPTDFPDAANGEVPANFEEVNENLSPEDWENPTRVIEKLESFSDEKALNEFLKENGQKIESIGGKDGELITAVIESKKKELSGILGFPETPGTKKK